MYVTDGLFYEFHIFRIVSHPGQPIVLKQNVEIWPIISRERAVEQVRNGNDVYTLRKSDAEKLARQLYSTKPEIDLPHEATYFQHFHPGGLHPQKAFMRGGRPRAQEGPGHIFFGVRGENFVPKR